MKNKIKTFLAAFIAGMAFFYLAVSFYKLSFNPVIWGEDTRLCYCLLLSLISVGGGFWAIEETKNN